MKNITKIFILVFLTVISLAQADAKSPPSGSGAGDIQANILILLDTSNSMQGSSTQPDADALKYPVGAVFDSQGNIFAASNYNTIYKYNPALGTTSNLVKSWGSYGSGNGQFQFINDIAIDSSDRIYVADSGNGRVQRFSNGGNFLSKFNVTGGDVKSLDVAGDGYLYIVNGNNKIEKRTLTGSLQNSWNSNAVSGVKYIAADKTNNSSSRLFVTTSSGSTKTITIIKTSDGTVVKTINLAYIPDGIALDRANKKVYVVSVSSDQVYEYNLGVDDLTFFKSYGANVKPGPNPGSYKNPKNVDVKSDGTVYVADTDNHRFQKPSDTVSSANILIPFNFISKLSVAQDVIQTIVGDSSLTASANFGFMTWSGQNSNVGPCDYGSINQGNCAKYQYNLMVPVSDNSSTQISSLMGTLYSDGNATLLAGPLGAAKKYFEGTYSQDGVTYPSPRNLNASCQKNIVIVISDGVWFDTTDSNTAAAALYSQDTVKTYVVGFNFVGDISNYVDLSVSGGTNNNDNDDTNDESPLFAGDKVGLLNSLIVVISAVIDSQFTFTVPTIVPGVAGKDSLIQSTFSYKKDHQWKGHLYKYALDSQGIPITPEAWDAGDMLNKKSADNRKIWTVGDYLTYDPNNNNFTTTDQKNFNWLKYYMSNIPGSALSDLAATNLIQFIRGKDSYGEYPSGKDDEGTQLILGERWKLADIYHSKAITVGVPSSYYSDSANQKSESYYRFANNYKQFIDNNSSRKEMVYVGSNGGMLHAIDSSTGDEKWAFIPPSLLPALSLVASQKPGQSYSIFAVDGSPVVKDILINGSWKTILFSGLRQGGGGYFALDITDPDHPKHMFSFDYNRFTNYMSIWQTDTSNSTKTQIYDMTKSNSIPYDSDFSLVGESWSDPLILNIDINGTRKWVGIFGGGYNNNISGYGNAVYIIDLENGGKILKRIDITENSSMDGISTSVTPRLTAITADTSSTFPYAGAYLYFTATDGVLWQIDLTDQGNLYATTKIFDAEATYNNDRLTYQQVTPTILADGKLMNYFGTGDISRIARINKNNVVSIQNRAFAIKDSNYPNFVNQNSAFKASSLLDVTGSSDLTQCPTSLQNGWFFNLDTNEKIVAPATVWAGEVLFSRYTPNSTDLCGAGTSKLSEHSFACGGTLRTTDLGSGVATEAVVYNDKIYIGISSDAQVNFTDSVFSKTGNLIVGTPVTDPTPTVDVEYWKEDF